MGLSFVGVDLVSEKPQCICDNPNGFKFLEYGPNYQVWTHLKCGGQVVRPLIKSGKSRGELDKYEWFSDLQM